MIDREIVYNDHRKTIQAVFSNLI